MIENTKCECGHQNALGTLLCEACGNPLEEIDSNELLAMRYDGVARRSQKNNPNVLDRVWRFFSSVKVAIYLIILTLLASIIGSIYPQESFLLAHVDPARYYSETYGLTGQIYHALGFSNTYQSWWYNLLLIMIVTSLVVCSLDRVLPLYRALKTQKVRKHQVFIERQKIYYTTTVGSMTFEGISNVSDTVEHPADQAASQREVFIAGWLEKFGGALRKRRYRVRYDDGALLAEKNRFSRWGPYINHIGLIIFFFAVMMRTLPGWHMDQELILMEGETKLIAGTHYFVKSEAFRIDFYEDDVLPQFMLDRGEIIPRTFETDAILYVCSANCDERAELAELEEVHRQTIQVNHPLKYQGLLLYQMSFAPNPQILAIRLTVTEKGSSESHGPFELNIRNPQTHYNAGEYQLELFNYLPDFVVGQDGIPVSKSIEPNAPAFVFMITGPELRESGEPYIFFPYPRDRQRFQQDRINGDITELIEISAGGMDAVDISIFTTVLNARVDRAVPYIFVGAVIFLIGVVMGLYWQHRRIWVRWDEHRMRLGAHTNKNWFGIRGDVASALSQVNIEIDPKLLDRGGEHVDSDTN